METTTTSSDTRRSFLEWAAEEMPVRTGTARTDYGDNRSAAQEALSGRKEQSEDDSTKPQIHDDALSNAERSLLDDVLSHPGVFLPDISNDDSHTWVDLGDISGLVPDQRDSQDDFGIAEDEVWALIQEAEEHAELLASEEDDVTGPSPPGAAAASGTDVARYSEEGYVHLGGCADTIANGGINHADYSSLLSGLDSVLDDLPPLDCGGAQYFTQDGSHQDSLQTCIGRKQTLQQFCFEPEAGFAHDGSMPAGQYAQNTLSIKLPSTIEDYPYSESIFSGAMMKENVFTAAAASEAVPSAGGEPRGSAAAQVEDSSLGSSDFIKRSLSSPTGRKWLTDKCVISPTTGKEMKLGPGFMGKVAVLPSAVQALFSDINSQNPRKAWKLRNSGSQGSLCSPKGDDSGGVGPSEQLPHSRSKHGLEAIEDYAYPVGENIRVQAERGPSVLQIPSSKGKKELTGAEALPSAFFDSEEFCSADGLLGKPTGGQGAGPPASGRLGGIAAGVVRAAVEVSKKNPLPTTIPLGRAKDLSASAARRPSFKGISRPRWTTNWHVHIPMEEGPEEDRVLGHFPCPEQAARAHDVAILALHQADEVDESKLNYPAHEYEGEDMQSVRDLSPSQFLLMLNQYSTVRSNLSTQPTGSRYRGVWQSSCGKFESKYDKGPTGALPGP